VAFLVNNIGKEIWHKQEKGMIKELLFEQNTRQLYAHNQRVDNFLRSQHIPPKCVDFENVALYGFVKSVLQYDIVKAQPKQVRQFNKFCRQWLSNSGNLSQAYMAKIQKQAKYYYNKQRNAQRAERIKQKQNSTV